MSSDLYKSTTVHVAPQKEPEAPRRELNAIEKQALAEAAARKAAREAEEAARPKEYNGRGGLDPARYGDWEVKGITSDF